MIDGLCNYLANGNGKMGVAVLTAVGGLHMALSESQPVLGMFDAPSFGWFSVQHSLGLVLAVSGLCCVKVCME